MRRKQRRPEQPLPPTTPRRDPRDETIARAMDSATSAASRAQARDLVRECGSPVVAARDVFVAYAEAAETPDPRYVVACQAGCWFCCTTPVGVTVFEAAMVQSAVLALPEAEQHAIRAGVQAHVAQQDAALAAAPGPRVAFQRRCPLLNQAGQCSVYEARPLACRALLSLDAERCRRSFLEDDPGDPATPFVLTNNAAIFGIPQLMVTLDEGQLDCYPSYELASALAKLWLEPGSFVAWQQGAPFASAGSPRYAEGNEIYPSPEARATEPPAP